MSCAVSQGSVNNTSFLVTKKNMILHVLFGCELSWKVYFQVKEHLQKIKRLIFQFILAYFPLQRSRNYLFKGNIWKLTLC